MTIEKPPHHSDDQADPSTWLDMHGDFLFNYARVRVRDHALAEDMVQDTLVAAFRARGRYNPNRSLRAWLVGILKHKIIDHFRKASRETLVEDEESLNLAASRTVRYFGIPESNLEPLAFNPRDALEQAEFWKIFTSCLEKLDRRLHLVFVLKEMDGEPTQSVCKELNISSNHLWVLLHRARKGLRKCLEHNWLNKPRGSA